MIQPLVLLASALAILASATPSGATSPSQLSAAQPTLPDVWVVTDPAVFTLSENFEITNVPTTREYYWNLTTVAGGTLVLGQASLILAPDGFARPLLTVNGQFPGPLIEANEGDRIVVHLTNNLNTGQTLRTSHHCSQCPAEAQIGTGFTKTGLSGWTCPVQANGGTFTYEFTIRGQYGTYWYHSHYGATLADGLSGALVVHSPNDPLQRGRDYDEDRIVYVQDWEHDLSDVIAEALRTPGGYKGIPGAPALDAVLINGVGRTNCSAAPAGSNCTTPALPVIQVPVGKKIRFRVVNSGADATLRLSLDNHSLEVIEADDTAVYGPKDLHDVGIGCGQRYSLVVTTDQGKPGDEFTLRATAASKCLNTNKTSTMTAIVQYVDADGTFPGGGSADSQPWPDLVDPLTFAACDDLDQHYPLTPRVAEDAPTEVTDTHVMNSMGINSVSYEDQINYPLTAQIQDGVPLNASNVYSATFASLGAGDIIFNNLDVMIPHPVHLHGRYFYIVARGTGNITSLDGVQVNTTNPLRRDTLQLPITSWAVLRLVTDTPGAWALHCHIAWHLAVGKMAAVVVQPDAVREFDRPQDWLALCAGTDPQAIGPDRRDVVPTP